MRSFDHLVSIRDLIFEVQEVHRLFFCPYFSQVLPDAASAQKPMENTRRCQQTFKNSFKN